MLPSCKQVLLGTWPLASLECRFFTTPLVFQLPLLLLHFLPLSLPQAGNAVASGESAELAKQQPS